MAESYEDAVLRIEAAFFQHPAIVGHFAALDRFLALENADSGDLRAALRATMTAGLPDLRTPYSSAVNQSAFAGIETSARTIHPAIAGNNLEAQALVRKARATFALSPAVLEILDSVDPEALAAINNAWITSRSGATNSAALAEIRGSRNALVRKAVSAINQAGNEATRHTATTAGLPVVWVAERNACVICLAYSGQTVGKNESFDGGLTYSSRPSLLPGILTPPRHPYCRCHLEPLKAPEYAAALRREADRSILRGFALPNESRVVRLDAAKTLLDKPGLVAPKSVKRYAARSVKNGAFDPNAFIPGPGGHNGPTPPNQDPPKPPPATPKTPKTPTTPKTPAAPKTPTRRPPTTPATPPPATPPVAPPKKLSKVEENNRRLAALDDKQAKADAGEGLGSLPRTKTAVTLAHDATLTNPGNAIGEAYKVNCTNAVTALELRARGYDVIAQARPELHGRSASEMFSAWREPGGGIRSATWVKNKTGLEAEVLSWPEGGRGFVNVEWTGRRTAHVFTVENRGGTVVFHEPQVPGKTSADAADFYGKISPGRLWATRTDDLQPTDKILEFIHPRTAELEADLVKKAAKAQLLKNEGLLKYEEMGARYAVDVQAFNAGSTSPENYGERLAEMKRLEAEHKKLQALRRKLNKS